MFCPTLVRFMSKVQTDFKVTPTRTELFSVCAPAKKGDSAAPETNSVKFADSAPAKKGDTAAPETNLAKFADSAPAKKGDSAAKFADAPGAVNAIAKNTTDVKFADSAPAKKGDTAAPEINSVKFADSISPITCASAAQDQKVQKVQTSSHHTGPQVQVISSSKPLRPTNCQDHALVSIMSFNCLISGAF